MQEKYLVEKKENIFSKIFNRIKSFFKSNKAESENIHEPEKIDNISEEKIESWVDTIKIPRETEDVLKLQEQFENNDINSMSLEELKQLGDFYKNKIKKLEEDINYNNASIDLLQKQLNSNEN